MSATANITAAMLAQVSAPAGTDNRTQQRVDSSAVITATTDTIAQIDIRPDDTIVGDPQTIVLKLMADLQAVTPDNTTETIGLVAHGFDDGQPVHFTAAVIPTGLTAGLTYYVRDKTADDFKLALTPGGAVVAFSTDGTTVKVRPLGGTGISYAYPTSGPQVPVQIRDSVNGPPDDFTTVKAMHIVLRPLDPAADASGRVKLTAGNTGDPYDHFSIPLALAFTAGGAQSWPSWTAALPAGFLYNPDYHFTVLIEDDAGNANLLLIINLLGN